MPLTTLALFAVAAELAVLAAPALLAELAVSALLAVLALFAVAAEGTSPNVASFTSRPVTPLFWMSGDLTSPVRRSIADMGFAESWRFAASSTRRTISTFSRDIGYPRS